LPSQYNIGDVIDVNVEKIVPRGLGLAFAEKLTVFVGLAAPGDRLRVRIHELKKRTAFAEIVEVLEPGPDRIEPPCPIFGICGGCDFQQLSYNAQLAAKVEIIRDCLTRIGKIELNVDIQMIGSPQQFEYRSRARWHAQREARTVGFRKRHSHEVVDVTGCPISTPELRATFEEVKSGFNWEMMFDDTASAEGAVGDSGTSVWSSELGAPSADITSTALGENYTYDAETFFQANRSLTDKLVDAAVGNASGETALDLFCGVGLFTLPLARRFKDVIGVEGNPSAIEFAKRNAANAGLTNIEFEAESVGRFLGSIEGDVDLVLIDPPRAGTEDRVIQGLLKLRPKRISYVSCEPSILARDLREILDAGYTIDSVTALDMFPQTHHVETVVHIKRD
jgi:tRNA/tmRNA/rRNA uracil-C5-methylase (TrmA/RlmC/RlmD family)